jgi:Fungal specific transcription factor domain
MLAMGSIFAPPEENKANSKLFVKIARHAVDKNFGNFSLQLVQSRLLMGLLHFALGESTRAWDYCGSALRAACALNFNTEAGVDDLTDDQIPEYGLSRDALIECQRRTMWSAYIMDVSLKQSSPHRPKLI